MLIQAFRRTKAIEIEFAGRKLAFAVNDQGHVVADVPPGALLNRLISITTDYREYTVDPAAIAEHQAALEASTATAVTAAEEEQLRLAQERARKPIDESEDTESSPYILTDEEAGTRIDLRELDLEALKLFARTNEVPFHPNTKAETLRDKIAKQLNDVGTTG